ncbi:MAG: T9SS type A sorting domain-containing protein [Flavobacteriales bacterium]|nr:T9SS type A sorting domain-containing protein [Flavobacteriales bacterium]
MFKLKQLITFSFLLLTSVLSAQETFSSSGFNSNGNSGIITYTVGQVAIDFNTGNNGSLIQGVQQPYEIFSTLGNDILYINLNLIAYPNPTTDKLVLSIENFKGKKFYYELFNMEGKSLLFDKCIDNKTYINLNEFPSNTYLLSIVEKNTVIKTFRIIKN